MWLHIPTSLYSPASECLTSGSTSLYQALAASVTVSGKARQPRYWRRAWQKANWTKCLSTPTCDPSQSNRIVAEWLESLAASPAKTSALPADRQASTATAAGCSLRSSDLFASWNPSIGCFSKTSLQSSLFPQEQPYSENLPRSGSMRNGQLFERPIVARRIDAIERSYWPTADANTSTYSNGQRGENLRESAANWPTPRGTDGAKGGPNQAGSRGDLMLPSAAAMWSTPNVPNGGRTLTPEDVENRGATKNGKRQVGLENEAKFWSTPRTITGGGESGNRKKELGRTESGGGDLQAQVAEWNAELDYWSASSADTSLMRTADDTVAQTVKESAWPTPAARDHKGTNSTSHMDRSSGAKHLDQLPNFVEHCFHQAPETPQPGPQSSQSGQNSRRLSPVFVEWLMAVPRGWTDFAPLGTEWSRYRQQLRSAYWRIVREFSGVQNEG